MVIQRIKKSDGTIDRISSGTLTVQGNSVGNAKLVGMIGVPVENK